MYADVMTTPQQGPQATVAAAEKNFYSAGATAAEADLQDSDDTHWQGTQQPGLFYAQVGIALSD